MSVFIHRWCGYTCIEYDHIWSINTWGPKQSRLWLARYLMKFTMHFPCPCTSGIVLHAEALLFGCLGEILNPPSCCVTWFIDWIRQQKVYMVWDLEAMRVSTIQPLTTLSPFSQADFGGTDGASFWVERRTGFTPLSVNPHSTWRHGTGRKSEDGQAIKRYLLSGEGLDSRPVMVLVGSNGVTNRNII